MADYLIAYGHLESFYQFFYAIPIALLATCKLVFGDGLLAFAIFQSLLSTAAALFLYHGGVVLFNAKAGFLTAVIFLLWLDCIQWNTAIMTESLASSLICMVIYLLIVFNESAKHFALLMLLLLANLMTRPTGVLIILGAVVFMLLRYSPFLRQRVAFRGVLYVSLSIIFLTGAWVMLNEWDFTDQYEKGNIVTYMDVIKGQPLYDETLRLDTSDLRMPDKTKRPAEKIFLFAIENPMHYAKAGVLKVFYLISFYRPYFSTAHNLYTVLWLLMIYGLFFLGLRHVRYKPMKGFVVSIILANCLLVAISAADWDNRFYMPMQPGIALLAGGGLVWLRRLREDERT